MSSLINTTYTFTPSSSTVTLTGIANFNITNLTGIVNVTTGNVVYARGVINYGYSSISGSTLTLEAPMTGMSSTDVLAIKYESFGGNDVYTPYGSPFSVTSATTLFSVDTQSYNSISVQVTSAGTTCTISYQVSNDNANRYAIWGTASSNVGSSGQILTTTAAGIWHFPCISRYFRAIVTTYTSGTVTVIPILRTTSLQTMEVVVGGGSLAVTSSVAGKATSGGLSQYGFRTPTAAAANAAVIKSSVGQIYGYHFTNNATTTRYIHFYNTTTVPTMGTTADVRVVAIPPSSNIFYNASDIGIAFSSGISIAVTTSYASTDNTVANIAVGDIVGMIDYN